MKINERFSIYGNEKFRFIDNKVSLNRFKLEFITNELLPEFIHKPIQSTDEIITEEVTNIMCFVTESDLNMFIDDFEDKSIFTITKLNIKGKKWIESYKFETIEAAQVAYDLDESTYLANLDNNNKTEISIESVLNLFNILVGEE